MRSKLLAGVVGLALVAAACGDDSAQTTDTVADTSTPATTDPETTESEATDPETTEPETTAPETTEPETTAPETTEPDATAPETTGAATTDAAAEGEDDDGDLRIVSLSPTLTEMMFAIDAGDQLVAVDQFSNYPDEALELPNELSGFEPNVEAIAGYEPDVVLISGDFTGLGDQLTPLGIEIFDGPAAVTLDDTYTQIEQLGALTGHVGEAAEVVSQIQTDIDEIVAGLPEPPAEPLTYFHELGPELYTSTSNTFIGQIYGLLGLENIADTAADETDYPQLNAEFLIDANPDLIFLSDTLCCGETAESVAARDGWDAIAAVQNDAVIEMNDDIASRWGPRVVEYLEAAAVAVASVTETAAS